MEYKGDLKGFPQEVVEKMVERQVEQGNKRDVSIFEKDRNEEADFGGFDWDESPEGYGFWYKVIYSSQFDVFFNRYPKKEYPRVMLVSDNKSDWFKRVVFMEKKNKYLTWINAETIEDSEKVITVVPWLYAKEIEEKPSIEITVKINGKEAKLSDISEETLNKLRKL